MDIDNLFNDPFATLRHFLTFVVPKKYVDELFRGELLMLSQKNKTQPFVFVPLKLPDAPLFRDVMEKNAIPQVALAELLKPFALKTAPEYLILAFVNRFSKNQFTKEVSKNPTIVTFPVKNLKIASSSSGSNSNSSNPCFLRLARQRRLRRQSDRETHRRELVRNQRFVRQRSPRATSHARGNVRADL